MLFEVGFANSTLHFAKLEKIFELLIVSSAFFY